MSDFYDEKEKFQLFQRIRRNLMVTCVFILIIKTGGIKIEKFSFLGNELSVSDPAFIKLWMILFFTYFTIRYISVAIQLGLFSRPQIERLKVLEDEIERCAEKKLTEKAEKLGITKTVFIQKHSDDTNFNKFYFVDANGSFVKETGFFDVNGLLYYKLVFKSILINNYFRTESMEFFFPIAVVMVTLIELGNFKLIESWIGVMDKAAANIIDLKIYIIWLITGTY